MTKRLLALVCLILLLGINSFPGITYSRNEEKATGSMFLSQNQEHHPINPVFSLTEDATRWMRTYGSTGQDSAWSVIQTTDGGYALAGSTDYFKAWLMKTDNLGNVQWTQTYNFSSVNAVIQTTDAGYALAGTRVGQSGSDALLVKTNIHGMVQWNQTYDWENKDEAKSVIQTNDGGFVLGGSSSGGGYGLAGIRVYRMDWDAWLVKTDANGTREWVQNYGGSNHDHLFMVIPTGGTGFVFVGDTWSYGAGFNDIWLVKIDIQGKMAWNQTYGAVGNDRAYEVIQMPDAGFALVGATSSFGEEDFDTWLIKTDADGNMQWSQTYGGTSHDAAYSGTLTPDGGFVLAGSTKVYRARRYDMNLWVMKLSARGELQWTQIYGGLEDDEANSVIQTVDGGFILAGRTRSYEASGGVRYKSDWDAWLVKTDANGIAPDIKIELINWFEIGLLVSLVILAIVVGILYVRRRRSWRPKWH